MYVPRHFEMSEVDALALARHVAVGHLVTNHNSHIESTLLPFAVEYLDDRLVVVGHIAAANPQRQAIENGCAGLLIVHGPDAYVSPSLYPSKADGGRVVPTWNYALVHLRGPLHVVDQPDKLLALVSTLTTLNEAHRDAPWSVNDAPADFIDGQLKAIIGFEMRVDTIEGKAKLSQNRPVSDALAVRDAFLVGTPRQREVGEMMS
jgi:transcriptional regulator